jgi:Na+-transporting NADH:ubiquinone oxidoreductase subunit C
LKGSLYTIVYAVCVGTCCAALLTAAAEVTRPYRDANELAERQRNVLGVLGVSFDRRATAAELNRLFDEHVRREEIGPLVAYRLVGEGEDAGAVAVEVAGKGAWGPVRGFLALESDWATVRGITFHDHQETPGLGGEISEEPFRRQFRGKRLFADDGTPGIRIVARDAEGPTEVDAISGATITCNRVEAMLRGVAEQVAKLRVAEGRP